MGLTNCYAEEFIVFYSAVLEIKINSRKFAIFLGNKS